MSYTAEADDVVEVTASGVVVRKSFTPEEFPVPTIRFEFESTLEEPVTIRLTERIPEDFPMDNVGFHPEYQSDNWTAFKDNYVEFTGTIEPEEPLETVYGIRIGDEYDVEAFLEEPEMVEVEANGAVDASDADAGDDEVIDGIISDDRNQVVKDMLAGESDGVPGLEDETEPSDESDAIELDLEGETAETDDANDESASAADEEEPSIELDLEAAAAAVDEDDDEEVDDDEAVALDYDDAGAETTTSASTVQAESTAARLAAELESGEADESDLEVLKKRLGGDGGTSDRVRFGHLQSRVEEVAAYADALEEFIDENGTGNELIAEVRGRLDSYESGLEGFSGRVEELEADFESLESSVAALQSDLESSIEAVEADVESSVEEVESSVESLRRGLATVRNDVKETGDGLEAVEADVGAVDERVDGLADDVDSVTGEVETLDGDVDDLRTDVDTLEGDVDDLEDDVAAVREDVTDIVEWREQLGSMFRD